MFAPYLYNVALIPFQKVVADKLIYCADVAIPIISDILSYIHSIQRGRTMVLSICRTLGKDALDRYKN